MVALEKLQCVPVYFMVWQKKITVHTVKCTETIISRTVQLLISAVVGFVELYFPRNVVPPPRLRARVQEFRNAVSQ